MRTIYIVDQTGATFWFDDKSDAEAFLVAEAWRGAAHLNIVTREVPADVTDIDNWAVSNAGDPGCDQ